ncbi:MAG: hypothetical protein ABSE77_18120 [Acidimicrobiales bacterium]
MTSAPSELKTSSKLAVNFVSRSRMRKLHRTACLGQVADQVPGDFGDECVVRVFGDAEEVKPAGWRARWRRARRAA